MKAVKSERSYDDANRRPEHVLSLHLLVQLLGRLHKVLPGF